MYSGIEYSYPPNMQRGAEILAAKITAGLEELGNEVLELTSSPGLPKGKREGQIRRTLRSASLAHFD